MPNSELKLEQPFYLDRFLRESGIPEANGAFAISVAQFEDDKIAESLNQILKQSISEHLKQK